MSLSEFKKKGLGIISEFFVSGDGKEVETSLKELGKMLKMDAAVSGDGDGDVDVSGDGDGDGEGDGGRAGGRGMGVVLCTS